MKREASPESPARALSCRRLSLSSARAARSVAALLFAAARSTVSTAVCRATTQLYVKETQYF